MITSQGNLKLEVLVARQSPMSFGRNTSQSLLLSAAACILGVVTGVVVSPSAAKGMLPKTKDNSWFPINGPPKSAL